MTITEDRPVTRNHVTEKVPEKAPASRPERVRVKKKLMSPMRIAIAAILVLAIGGTAAAVLWGGKEVLSNQTLTYNVTKTSFDVRIKMAGELKAVRNVEIRNDVEGQTTLMWLIPEGSVVKEGDLLATLASDAIRDRVEDARIRVENSNASAINARETVTIQINQNESDIKNAETNAELAELEYNQFTNGDAIIELKNIETKLENAKTNLTRKETDWNRVQKLAENKFVSDNDVLDARINLNDAKNALEVAEMDLTRWKLYSEPRQRQTLERRKVETMREVERTKRRAAANLLLREADQRAKERGLRWETMRLTSLEEQLAACEIRAPQPGMVVYQSSVQNNSQGPIEEGMTVRQNQVIIQLPDTTRMMAEIRIAEQLTDRIAPGQTVLITVDAVPGQVLTGKVDKISPLPDSSNRWMNPNLKEYPTFIMIDHTPKGLKPGMSVKAEIEVASLTDVIAVPVQAVFTSGGQPYVYVGSPENFEKRPVSVGLSSADYTEIKDGLKTGEIVLLSRPKNAAEDQPPASRPTESKQQVAQK